MTLWIQKNFDVHQASDLRKRPSGMWTGFFYVKPSSTACSGTLLIRGRVERPWSVVRAGLMMNLTPAAEVLTVRPKHCMERG
jgi:hypothetical protein